MESVTDKIESIYSSLSHFLPETALISGILVVIITGLISQRKDLLLLLGALVLFTSLFITMMNWQSAARLSLFNNMLRYDAFSDYLKILCDISGIITLAMTWRNQKQVARVPEYVMLLIIVILGSHLLVMSINLIMIFISLEIISLASYVLAGFSFSKHGAEGSFKYFLFGSVSSAIMLYGFTLMYGLTGSLDFTSLEFTSHIANTESRLLFVSALMALAGFLYKIAAAPMHLWAPDVYESAPMPVVAFFSIVPKLAGIGILTRFTLALNVSDSPVYNWQNVLALVAILTIAIGNFSALWQSKPRRLMAYSSIAQTGFLLVGICSFVSNGVQFMLFYATVYMVSNFLVFVYLQYFEDEGFAAMESFSGIGKTAVLPSLLILVGFIALTGLPPTAGFTAKLFVFTSLWEAYQQTGKDLLLWLLVFGLLNTVISLFYYIRIPYYAFVKPGKQVLRVNFFRFENLFGLLLVVIVLILFFNPGLLMGWINKINFVL